MVVLFFNVALLCFLGWGSLLWHWVFVCCFRKNLKLGRQGVGEDLGGLGEGKKMNKIFSSFKIDLNNKNIMIIMLPQK